MPIPTTYAIRSGAIGALSQSPLPAVASEDPVELGAGQNPMDSQGECRASRSSSTLAALGLSAGQPIPMPLEITISSTLAAMISPALFLTATGSLIISTSNRMSRIVDRIRILTELSDQIDRGESNLDFPERRQQHIAEQLVRLVWRSDRVRSALTLLYAALAAFVGTSLALALDVLLGHLVEAIPTMLAIAGVFLLMVASLQLVGEARAALAGNSVEVEFFRELYSWRHRPNGPGTRA